MIQKFGIIIRKILLLIILYRNLKAKIDLLLNKYIENNINYFTIVSNKNNTIDFELKKKLLKVASRKEI